MFGYEKTRLGQHTEYNSDYDPRLLCPLPRRDGRQTLWRTDQPLPFVGVDIWHHYEVSWLDANGKPQVAVARIAVPADSVCLIESKSMKLYFNSLNFHRFANREAFIACVEHDLSAAAQGTVRVSLESVHQAPQFTVLEGVCLDDLPVADCQFEHPNAQMLALSEQTSEVRETLFSHLLRSNCPVTGQPDWATVVISYQGQALNHESVLRYLLAYRQHSDFHEQCVERIFIDLLTAGHPTQLTVYACYTRRGGLDINPFRSNCQPPLQALPRLLRQ